MSFETLTNQEIKALLALRKDVIMELTKELSELLSEVDKLEEILDARNIN